MRAIAAALPLLILSMPAVQAADVERCVFDRAQFSYPGTAREQAQCLLRPVRKWGKVDKAMPELPTALGSVGEPAATLKRDLRKYLADKQIAETSLGGSLDGAVSATAGGAGASKPARYFVIHDTSAPWLGNATGFPANTDARLNAMAQYGGADSVAHVFVNRLGKTLVGHDFSVPWRATKLETKSIGTASRGLFLHVELLQPRRRDPAGGPKNDAIAPEPGFTDAQYDMLALLYAVASARAGSWMIPAFHATLDQGLSDAHDDPQNFDLAKFGVALEKLKSAIQPAG